MIIQTDLLNDIHLSTLICPVTTNIKSDVELLRVHLKKDQLSKLSDVLVDQIRAIDNNRLIKRLGGLTKDQILMLKNNIKIILDL